MAHMVYVMANHWIALADKYLERQYVRLTGLLKVSDGNGSPLAAHAASVARSRARFAQFLELFHSGSGVTADDLETFRHPTAPDLVVFKELLGDVLQMHFVKVLAEDAGYVSPSAHLRNGPRCRIYGEPFVESYLD